jgi:hypothetical protein
MPHTPGPWRVSEYECAVFADNPYGKDLMRIADVRGWGHLTGKAEGGCKFSDKKAGGIQDSNALLIAAAPELLEACNELLKLLESLEDSGIIRKGVFGSRQSKDGGIGRAHEVIAKAEGR